MRAIINPHRKVGTAFDLYSMCLCMFVISLYALLCLTPGRKPPSASALLQGCPSGVHSPEERERHQYFMNTGKLNVEVVSGEEKRRAPHIEGRLFNTTPAY